MSLESLSNKIKKYKVIVIACIFIVIAIIAYSQTALCGVDGNSMYPTLRNGDLLFMDRGNYCNKGDIVVINSDELGSYIVKRVIGVAGDTLEIKKDGLYINGTLQHEDYVSESDWYTSSAKTSVSIPEGYVFVMGDNRSGSYDSRDIGLLSLSCVFGVMLYDMSNIIGLSAFGFKLLFGICLLLLCGYICIHPFRHKSAENKSEIEETKVVLDEPVVVETEPCVEAPVTMFNTSTKEDTVPYWKHVKNPVNDTILPKE